MESLEEKPNPTIYSNNYPFVNSCLIEYPNLGLDFDIHDNDVYIH